MEKRIKELLRSAKAEITEATNLINEIEISEKVGENYIIRPEFEEIVAMVYDLRETTQELTHKYNSSGVLDRLENNLIERLKTFFKKQYKQKKYEGSLMEIGYKVVTRKIIDGNPDSRFIKLVKQPDVKSINAYMKATISDENPDGLLPEGIKESRFEYITYHPVINKEK